MKQNQRYIQNTHLKTRLFTHLDTLFEHHSKILMLRVDLAYRKDSKAFITQDEKEMAWQMILLTEQLTIHTDIIGFAWVMECSELHGIHIHAAFYLDGQRHRKIWNTWEAIKSLWMGITVGEGYAHRCEPKIHYRVRGEWVIRHDDNKGRGGMQYILSYLSKVDQKEGGLIYRVSDIPAKKQRGRPRRKSIAEGMGW